MRQASSSVSTLRRTLPMRVLGISSMISMRSGYRRLGTPAPSR